MGILHDPGWGDDRRRSRASGRGARPRADPARRARFVRRGLAGAECAGSASRRQDRPPERVRRRSSLRAGVRRDPALRAGVAPAREPTQHPARGPWAGLLLLRDGVGRRHGRQSGRRRGQLQPAFAAQRTAAPRPVAGRRMHPTGPRVDHGARAPAPAWTGPPRRQALEHRLRERHSETGRHRTRRPGGTNHVVRWHRRLPAAGRAGHRAGGPLQSGKGALRDRHRARPPAIPGIAHRRVGTARPRRLGRVQRGAPARLCSRRAPALRVGRGNARRPCLAPERQVRRPDARGGASASRAGAGRRVRHRHGRAGGGGLLLPAGPNPRGPPAGRGKPRPRGREKPPRLGKRLPVGRASRTTRPTPGRQRRAPPGCGGRRRRVAVVRRRAAVGGPQAGGRCGPPHPHPAGDPAGPAPPVGAGARRERDFRGVQPGRTARGHRHPPGRDQRLGCRLRHPPPRPREYRPTHRQRPVFARRKAPWGPILRRAELSPRSTGRRRVRRSPGRRHRESRVSAGRERRPCRFQSRRPLAGGRAE